MDDRDDRMTNDRRRLLQAGLGGLGAWLAGRWLRAPEASAAEASPAAAKPRADACIVLWMNGGPSHVDTFDPKPNTKEAGPFRAIKTSARGVSICEHLPRVAAEAHRLAILRGMTSREGSHERARQLGHTGHIPNPTVDHPALGAWVSARRGDPKAELPAFVSLGGPSASGGFFGRAHGPFVVREPGRPPEDMAYGPAVSATRFDRRRAALAMLEDSFEKETQSAAVTERRAVFAQAVEMMRSPAAAAFDVSSEPAAVREAYGDTAFGRGCLAARRLVEAGVPFVEVSLDGWDTHEDNFERTKRLMGVLDPAMSTLLRELAARGKLDRTLVVWMGEFGRTPRLNGRGGRDHHPAAWSAVLAGGGIRGGITLGATDAQGEKVVERPVGVADLFATITSAMGLDPLETVSSPGGRPITLTDGGQVVREIVL
ncbi:DUF1501 domain-containing protein [Polyangium sp. y55x31]|uniref:DUF1501 domain-containing protein n=1 Tax=Polyangium sp. y55x31 TaxID=3042688 RepID=UPI002482E973|nr:DUF1501 domain-containing protein [Polyangium sp. y55x31]MDI1484526.1 DUF1501 domain-containing protein [Polyangium sp. y55x31]